jgi:hypothetical protein
LGDIDERNDMDGELAEDRANDINVENVVLRALLGEGLDGLRQEISKTSQWHGGPNIPLREK